MAINVAKEVATLRHMTVSELRDKYHEAFGEDTNARNKQWLIKRIAWKLQANVEGDISQRARRLAHQIAMETDIRTTLPRVRTTTRHRNARDRLNHDLTATDTRVPLPEPISSRRTKGAASRSGPTEFVLSSKAQATSRSQPSLVLSQGQKNINGYHFFGLRKSEAKR